MFHIVPYPQMIRILNLLYGGNKVIPIGHCPLSQAYISLLTNHKFVQFCMQIVKEETKRSLTTRSTNLFNNKIENTNLHKHYS